ncbi:hypothetical protein M2322_003895 [Rhodoblastus acidophilus]|uniref:hypothetical protein n=1 Tax=Rhodoblastus acidophilus TaxID=1074 RepID=UPI00222588BF|nr:hypothetical protein [Rhodoblastus acidophilus]MCW2318326.1 hypothetical protein [Rhodoblastus acidophilus]
MRDRQIGEQPEHTSVENRIDEVMRFDVIIEIDPRAPPFRELPLLGRQIVEGGVTCH